MGTALIRRSDYYAISGADRAINKYGMGYDDIDLYRRLLRFGCQQQYFPVSTGTTSLFFRHIDHEERGKFYTVKDTVGSNQLNATYYIIKSTVLGSCDREVKELPFDYRVGLIDDLYELMLGPNVSSPATLEVALPPTHLQREQVTIERSMKFTIKL